MSLTEIMQNADLTIYPKVGLVIFAGIFILVVYRTLTMKRHMDVDRLAHLALEEDGMFPPGHDTTDDNTGGEA